MYFGLVVGPLVGGSLINAEILAPIYLFHACAVSTIFEPRPSSI